jgi:hypothetical protein
MMILRHIPLTLLSLATATPHLNYNSLSPSEFLQTTSPSVVLSTEFPSPELHSLWDEWKKKFERAYDTVEEGALRKLVWLVNHGAFFS